MMVRRSRYNSPSRSSTLLSSARYSSCVFMGSEAWFSSDQLLPTQSRLGSCFKRPAVTSAREVGKTAPLFQQFRWPRSEAPPASARAPLAVHLPRSAPSVRPVASRDGTSVSAREARWSGTQARRPTAMYPRPTAPALLPKPGPRAAIRLLHSCSSYITVEGDVQPTVRRHDR